MDYKVPTISPRHLRLAIVAIILLASALRLPYLEAQSIAFDESFSLVVGLAGWPTLFKAILSDGVHPPLFYILHKGALALWGTSEFGQRYLASTFSVVSVAFGYRAGRIIFDRQTGLLMALLLALNPLHAWLAQEARMYSVLGALTIVSMTAFWQALRFGRRRYWLTLAVVNSLIFGLHYFGFLVPVLQLVFIILTFQRNYQRLRIWTAIQAMACIPLLPWLIATAMREGQTFGIGFLVRPSLFDLPLTLWNLAVGGSSLFWPVIILTIIVSGVVLVFALRPIAPHKIWAKQARLLALIWVLLPPIITWLVSQRRSFYADRYLSFAIPGLALLLAFGISRVRQSIWRILLISGLIAACGFGLLATHLDPAFYKDDWRRAVTYISDREQPEDLILLYTTHIKFPFDYYYQGQARQKPISLNLEQFPIEPLTVGYRRAWVVYPYTRRPTHYPLQPLIPNGYWNDDPKRNPELVKWLAWHTNNIIDYQHFSGIQMWLVDLDTSELRSEKQ